MDKTLDIMTGSTSAVSTGAGRLSKNRKPFERDLIDRSGKLAAVVQYGLLYCALISGQSYLAEYFISGLIPAIGAVLIVVSVLCSKYWHFRDVVYLSFVLFLSALVGTYVGGVGVSFFLRLTCTLLLVSAAITFDLDEFPKRLVRTVVFFASISVVIYLARAVIPGFYYLLPLTPFTSQGEYWSTLIGDHVSYSTKGVLFFSVREGELRNIGFFTEPGVYQGVLNGTFFYLFFLRSRLKISSRETILNCIILLAALLTCGSTTGYVTFLVLFSCLLLVTDKGEAGLLKSRLIFLGIVVIVAAIVDFFVRGDESFLTKNVIDKIFIGDGGSVDLTEGNGGARFKTVVASLELLAKYPFGVGFDTVQAYKPTDAVGAGLFVDTAALGLPFLLVTLWWLFAPVFRSDLRIPAILAYIVMYSYFTFTQVLLMTPVIISIPIYLAISSEGVRREAHVALQR